MPPSPRRRLTVAAVLLAWVVGCGEGITHFEPDRLLRAKNGLTEAQAASIDAALIELFGTPDEPRLPEELPRLASLLDLEALQQAAGPVISHEVGVTKGLYRRHCARCHGITGDGRGPTARYQSPYPRDFRRGVFKWKSTYRQAPPTAADLHATLEDGVAGTAMPSFRLLPFEERDVLRQYVQYLAIRGQTERALVDFVANELLPEESLTFDDEMRRELLADWVEPIRDAWVGAEQQVVQVAAASDSLMVDSGRGLYHSERAGCYKCHGPEGQGGAVAGKDYDIDYDIWNRDRLADTASDEARRLLASDLPVRVSRPRQLAGSTAHGGGTFLELMQRTHQGIAGTPMPAVGGTGPGHTAALDDEEIRAVTAYVRSLMTIREDEATSNTPATLSTTESVSETLPAGGRS